MAQSAGLIRHRVGQNGRDIGNEGLLLQHRGGGVGIVHDHSGNTEILGLRQREGPQVDALLGQKGGHLVQLSAAVLQKHRNLSDAHCFPCLLSNLAFVDNPDRLPLAAGDGLGGHQGHLGLDPQHGLEAVHQRLLPRGNFGQIVGEHLRRHLHLYLEGVGVVHPVHDDQVVGGITVVQQHRFDLAGEHVDAPDNQHIVGAALGLGHPDVGPAAGALLPGEGADIPGAVAEEREGLLVHGGEHQLALLSLGEYLSGIGVNDLRDEVVLVDVHSLLRGALEGDARPAELREAVDIVGLDAQGGFDVPAHLLAPGLGAEDTGLQRDILGLIAHFPHPLPQESGIAGGAAENGGLQIHNEHNLTVGVAGAGGDGEAAHLVAAAVETGAAGEQTVAIGHLADVLFCAAGGHDGPGAAFLPQVDIGLGVEGHHALSGGAGGGLNAHRLREGNAQKAVGIRLPQIVLGKKREQVQVVDGLNVLRRDPLFLHLFPIVGDRIPHVPDLTKQPLVLEPDDLLPRGAFDLRLIIPFHDTAPLSFWFLAVAKTEV